MSLTQGYQQSGAMAEGLKSQMENMQDKPAGVVGQTSAGATVPGNSNPATSALGVPGYYHTQDQAADVRQGYRMAAAGFAPQNAQGVGLGASTLGSDSMPDYTKDFPALRNFKVDLTPADVEFFERRRAEQQQIEFDEFFAETIDLSDPGQARWAQQMYPEFWARREKFIDDKINVEARASKIRLRGIKDKEDLKFLFALRKGYITLPTEPAYTATPGGTAYKKGFFASRPAIGGFRYGASNVYPAPAAFEPIQGASGGRDRSAILSGFR